MPLATGSNLSSYNVVYVDGTLTVGKATPVVTWANPAGISYGTALSSTQLDASSTTPGTSSTLRLRERCCRWARTRSR